MNRGMLIVFEGLDRSGKTTQCQLLMDYFKTTKQAATLIQFPCRTTNVGKLLDAYLKSEIQLEAHVAHLLFSANRWEFKNTICELLRRGTHVVLDRYAFSGLAFSVAKNLPMFWCMQPDAGLPAPDIIFFLDVSPETIATRSGYGQERLENVELQKRAYEAYQQMLCDYTLPWVKLDASHCMFEIHNQVISELKRPRYIKALW